MPQKPSLHLFNSPIQAANKAAFESAVDFSKNWNDGGRAATVGYLDATLILPKHRTSATIVLAGFVYTFVLRSCHEYSLK
jgi:hypothetical protein